MRTCPQEGRKEMITTVTLNPAVDKTYTGARLLPGYVNRMDSLKSIAGGKGINVTKVLRQFDVSVRAMGFLGGYTGSFIEDSVKEIGAECDFVRVSQDTRCSMNLLTEDGYVTEILEPGPFISEEEMQQLLAAYETAVKDSDCVILSGSAPLGVQEDIYAVLIETAKQSGKRVFLDTSGSFLKKGAAAKPYLLKPNLKELETLTGKSLKTKKEAIKAAQDICRQGIENVVISMGDKGLLLVTETEILFAEAPKVKAINTVGCGDCVVASLAMSFEQGEDKETALKKAAALSAANATTLESGIIPMEKYEQLLAGIKVEAEK